MRSLCLTALIASWSLGAVAGVSAATPISFNRDIRPILADACFHCHGPDPGARQADLRLDREEGFFSGENGPPVVRGKPDDSPLYQRIMSSNPDKQMPPPEAHKQLEPEQKELLRRWIAEGAAWQSHWSFIAPTRPPLPAVKNSGWIRNPIDRFILAGLEDVGLQPAPEADRRTLARRASLDVTGLPPTPEEVELFVTDNSPGAYERFVERLLASPRYGEHRARYWLDAARYADTHGLHFDNYREMWPYRDWVINAFNRNQPFDQFTVEQLAADLLPNRTDEQLVATGFHRCNMTTNEGGTIAEENLANYARDRVETTAWVWLGLTANCAVCHDHKFDPITTRDFYSMSAFFRNTTQGALDGNIKDTKPVLYLPQSTDADRYRQVESGLLSARDALGQRRSAAGPNIDSWSKQVKPSDVDFAVEQLAVHAPLADGKEKSVMVTFAKGEKKEAKATAALEWRDDGKFGQAPVLAGDAALDLGNVGAFERDQPFTVSCWVRPPDKLNEGTILARLDPRTNAGWELYLQAGKVGMALNSAEPKNTLRVISRNPIVKGGQWVHLAVTYDGSGQGEGLVAYLNGNPIEANRQGNAITGSIRGEGSLVCGQRPKGNRLTGAALQDVRVYSRELNATEARTLAQLPATRAAAAVDAKKRNAQHQERLATFYLENLDEAYRGAAAQIQKLEDEEKAIRARSTITHIQEEKMDSPAMANILMRGQYDRVGEQVTPAVFAALNPLPSGAPQNRLGLAQWLVDARNPLTARVTVNRYWQEVFGTGLVKTAEDFGIMGEAPSHPELLDWLAVEFRESGWNVKHIFRLMLTSAAYRQSAVATPQKLERDRDNRLLSRGPRFRLDAEMIRDYALAASGSLVTIMGGPSTRPYQPEGIWDIVGLPGGNTRDYKPDTGANLYRRSLYTFWKRMAPPPNMETFNAPAREISCLRRERTNTPLQALVTLNDPQFVEASRRLAELSLQQSGGEPKLALRIAVERVLCRELKPAESKVIEATLAELLKHYQAHVADAQALIAVGESKPNGSLDPAQLAAWTNICNVLLNLDEALNK